MRERPFETAKSGDTTVAAGGNTGRHLRHWAPAYSAPRLLPDHNSG